MVRAMLSESLVAVISQTLCKVKDGSGRVAAHERVEHIAEGPRRVAVRRVRFPLRGLRGQRGRHARQVEKIGARRLEHG